MHCDAIIISDLILWRVNIDIALLTVIRADVKNNFSVIARQGIFCNFVIALVFVMASLYLTSTHIKEEILTH